MERYSKEIDGNKVFADNPVIIGDRQVFNPTEEQLLADGWQKYVEPAKTDEELLTEAKNSKLADIDVYNESIGVNQCYIRHDGATIPYWLERNDRAALRTTVNSYKTQGRTTYPLPLPNMVLTVDIDALQSALDKLEVYCGDSLAVTQQHKIAVDTLTSIDDVNAYDYTAGYPEKVTVEL